MAGSLTEGRQVIAMNKLLVSCFIVEVWTELDPKEYTV
jgi:hypothetical protein